jgi:hypothetical protein
MDINIELMIVHPNLGIISLDGNAKALTPVPPVLGLYAQKWHLLIPPDWLSEARFFWVKIKDAGILTTVQIEARQIAPPSRMSASIALNLEVSEGTDALAPFVLITDGPGSVKTLRLLTLTQRYTEYLSWAKEAWTTAENSTGGRTVVKPKRFMLSSDRVLNKSPTSQSSELLQRLERVAGTVAALGCNTMLAKDWRFDDTAKSRLLTLNDARRALAGAGILWEETATYRPFEYSSHLGPPFSPFDFGDNALARVTPAEVAETNPLDSPQSLAVFVEAAQRNGGIKKWAEKLSLVVATRQQPPIGERIVNIPIYDEPGPKLIALLDLLRFDSNADAHAAGHTGLANWLTRCGVDIGAFRQNYVQFLQNLDGDSNNWGAATWRDLQPVLPHDAIPAFNPLSTPEQRRLWRSTVDYFQHQFATGLSALTHYLRAELTSEPIQISFNPNNQYNNDLSFGDGYDAVAFNPDKLVLGFDRLQSARAIKDARDNGMKVNTLWFGDDSVKKNNLFYVSAYAALLRSASLLAVGNQGFADPPIVGEAGSAGAYIKPDETGTNEDEIAVRALNVIAAGAKTLCYYNFNALEMSWQEKPALYPQIALANALIAKSESVLYRARPMRSSVAILITSCSKCWSAMFNYALFQQERMNLHTLVSHSGFEADYLDETDLRNNVLTLNHYKVLYLTDPHLPEDCVSILADWVESGGVLVVMPGAASANADNTGRLPAMETLMGVGPREPLRFPVDAMRPLGEFFDDFNDTVVRLSSDGSQFLLNANAPQMAEFSKFEPCQAGLEPRYNYNDSNKWELYHFPRPQDPVDKLDIPVTMPLHHPVRHPTRSGDSPLELFVFKPASDVVVLAEIRVGGRPVGPGIIRRRPSPNGSGFVISYAFYAGHEYVQSGEVPLLAEGGGIDTSHQPRNWSAVARYAGTTALRSTPPIRMNSPARCKTSDPLTPRNGVPPGPITLNTLHGPDGTAIVVTNWDRRVLSTNAVYVIQVKLTWWGSLFLRVRSAREVPLTFKVSPIGSWFSWLREIEVTLQAPAPAVDVLTITVQWPFSQRKLPGKSIYAGPVTLFGGIAQGGGGFVVTASGQIKPVPPRTWKALNSRF